MQPSSKAVLQRLLIGNYIGAKHRPEQKVLKRATIRLDKDAIKIFQHEYRLMLNQSWLIRLKKRTGKGSDWHISLNPKKLQEIKDSIEGDNYDKT